MAAVLRNRLRETDLRGALRGDEFAVLLYAAAADAKNVAQTLAEAIATEVTVPGGHLSASKSASPCSRRACCRQTTC